MALSADAAAGASLLEVDAHLCSIPADAILNISFGLNLGAANEEVVTVVGVGSLLLQSPLRFDHNTSEALVLLDPPSAPPPYPPSPPPPTPPSPPSAPPSPPPSPPSAPPPSPTFPPVNFGRGGGPSAEGLGANAGDEWSMKHGTTQWLWLLPLILAETVLLLITAFADATDAHALSQPVAKEARLTMLEKEGPLPGWWASRAAWWRLRFFPPNSFMAKEELEEKAAARPLYAHAWPQLSAGYRPTLAAQLAISARAYDSMTCPRLWCLLPRPRVLERAQTVKAIFTSFYVHALVVGGYLAARACIGDVCDVGLRRRLAVGPVLETVVDDVAISGVLAAVFAIILQLICAWGFVRAMRAAGILVNPYTTDPKKLFPAADAETERDSASIATSTSFQAYAREKAIRASQAGELARASIAAAEELTQSGGSDRVPRLNLGPGAKDTYPCGQLTARESSGLYVDQSFGTNSRSASLASSTGYAQNYASRRGTAERESSGLYVDDRTASMVSSRTGSMTSRTCSVPQSKNFRRGTAERDETSGLYVDRASSLATGSRTCSVPTSKNYRRGTAERDESSGLYVDRQSISSRTESIPQGGASAVQRQIAQNYTQQQSFQDRVPDLSPPNPATDQIRDELMVFAPSTAPSTKGKNRLWSVMPRQGRDTTGNLEGVGTTDWRSRVARWKAAQTAVSAASRFSKGGKSEESAEDDVLGPLTAPARGSVSVTRRESSKAKSEGRDAAWREEFTPTSIASAEGQTEPAANREEQMLWLERNVALQRELMRSPSEGMSAAPSGIASVATSVGPSSPSKATSPPGFAASPLGPVYASAGNSSDEPSPTQSTPGIHVDYPTPEQKPLSEKRPTNPGCSNSGSEVAAALASAAPPASEDPFIAPVGAAAPADVPYIPGITSGSSDDITADDRGVSDISPLRTVSIKTADGSITSPGRRPTILPPDAEVVPPIPVASSSMLPPMPMSDSWPLQASASSLAQPSPVRPVNPGVTSAEVEAAKRRLSRRASKAGSASDPSPPPSPPGDETYESIPPSKSFEPGGRRQLGSISEGAPAGPSEPSPSRPVNPGVPGLGLESADLQARAGSIPVYTKAKTPRQMAGQPARDLTGRARPAQPAPQFRGAAQPFGAAPQFQPTADPSAATPRGQLVADDLQARSSVATPRTQAARVDRAKKCSGKASISSTGSAPPGMGEQIAETLREMAAEQSPGRFERPDRATSGLFVDRRTSGPGVAPLCAAPQPPPRGGFDATSATPRSKQIAEDLEGRTSAATPRTQAARVERARKGGDEKRPINPGMGSLEEGSIGADDRTESGMHVDYPTPRVSEASDATRTYSGMHTDYRTPRESEATEISEGDRTLSGASGIHVDYATGRAPVNTGFSLNLGQLGGEQPAPLLNKQGSFEGKFDATSATPRSKLVGEELENRNTLATPRTQASRVERAKTSKASLTSSGGYFGEGGVTAATPRTYAGRVDRAKTSKASLSSSGGYFGEVTAATPRTYAGRLGRAQGSKMSTSSKDSRPPPELEDAGVGGAFARLSEESELPEASIESVDVRPSMTQMQQVDFGGVQRRPSRRRTLWLGEQRVVAVTSAGARRILTVCWSLQFVVSAAFMILAWVATPAIFLNNNAEAVGVAFAWSIALRFFILEPLILRIVSCCGPLGGRLFLDNILGVHAYTIGRHPDERHDPPADVGVADDEEENFEALGKFIKNMPERSSRASERWNQSVLPGGAGGGFGRLDSEGGDSQWEPDYQPPGGRELSLVGALPGEAEGGARRFQGWTPNAPGRETSGLYVDRRTSLQPGACPPAGGPRMWSRGSSMWVDDAGRSRDYRI